MRALIFAPGECPGMDAMTVRYPVPMIPLIDRPFIQHLVRFLVDQGVDECDFVLSHMPEQIERFLGDGEDWSCRFCFHLARDPLRPYSVLKRLDLSGDVGPMLLGHADQLPPVRFGTEMLHDGTVAYCHCGKDGDSKASDLEWTGWAWVSSPLIEEIRPDMDAGELSSFIVDRARNKGAVIETGAPLSMRSYKQMLETHRRVLEKRVSDFRISCGEVKDGVWLSPNVCVHPTARIVPPVYVGEDCRIGTGAKIGPNAAIGSGCVIRGKCNVENAVILPNSYIGEALELDGVIVEENNLINAHLGTHLHITDDFIIGSLAQKRLSKQGFRAISRVAAVAVLVFLWPVLLLTALVLRCVREGPVLHRKEVVRLPMSPDEARWSTFKLWSFRAGPHRAGRNHGISDFFLCFLPALIHVARGDMDLVGVPPRTPGEVRELPSDWKALYIRSRVGIVTELDVHYGAAANSDEQYVADGYYAVNQSLRHDLKLLFWYTTRILRRQATAQ